MPLMQLRVQGLPQLHENLSLKKKKKVVSLILILGGRGSKFQGIQKYLVRPYLLSKTGHFVKFSLMGHVSLLFVSPVL